MKTSAFASPTLLNICLARDPAQSFARAVPQRTFERCGATPYYFTSLPAQGQLVNSRSPPAPQG